MAATRFAPTAFLLLILLAACATTRGVRTTEGAVTVRVENNLIPPTSLSVSVIPEIGGSSQLIGTVAPSETTTLSFDPPAIAGQYYLMATTTEGAEIISNPISPVDAAVVTWDVSANLATVTAEEPE